MDENECLFSLLSAQPSIIRKSECNCNTIFHRGCPFQGGVQCKKLRKRSVRLSVQSCQLKQHPPIQRFRQAALTPLVYNSFHIHTYIYIHTPLTHIYIYIYSHTHIYMCVCVCVRTFPSCPGEWICAPATKQIHGCPGLADFQTRPLWRLPLEPGQ